MTYVDGFVLPIPKKNTSTYRKMAQEAGKMWIKHGALQYVEAMGDDFKTMHGVKSFPKMVKPKSGETVWFSWIMYNSRAHRDHVNKAVMKAFEKKYGTPDMKMPFDIKRMAMGGFKPQVSFKKGK